MSSSFPYVFGRTLALILLEISAELEDWEFHCFVENSSKKDQFTVAEASQVLTCTSSDVVGIQPFKCDLGARNE